MISFIVGRLGKDAVNGTTKNGKPYMSFSMCENVYQNGETNSIWYNVTSFNQYDFGKQPYLKAGNLVSVVGETTVKPSITPNGKLFINYDIMASTINFVNVGKKKEDTEENTAENQSNISNTQTSVSTGDLSKLDKKETPTKSEPVVETKVEAVVAGNSDNSGDDDELPF